MQIGYPLHKQAEVNFDCLVAIRLGEIYQLTDQIIHVINLRLDSLEQSGLQTDARSTMSSVPTIVPQLPPISSME